MKDRLESILKHYKINSSKLAEMIEVQRSGISHILSGRNNPSYDFLIRILSTFPDINANWLLTGKGNMLDNDDEMNLFKEEDQQTYKSITSEIPDKVVLKSSDKSPLSNSTEQDGYKSNQVQNDSRSINKVIILYSDGKFKEYSQE